MEKDPVCGMPVEPAQPVEQRIYQERAYYFCSSACAAQFDKAPERYAPPQAQERDK